ncbi:MAG: hypothetical protein ACRDTR_20130 [Rubrobacter sp.]
MGRIFLTLFAGLLALALVGCGALSGSGSGGGSAGDGPQRQEQPGASGTSEETAQSTATQESGNPTLGSADAPVVMIEWGDFK